MAEDYTTTGLIAKVENDILDDLSDTSSPFTTDQALSVATDILREECAPFLINLHEEYYVAHEDTDLVDGQSGYDIPQDALGSILRDVTVYCDGDTTTESSVPQLSYDDIAARNWTELYGSSTVAGYYLKDHKVHIVPTPTNPSNITLRLSYYRRPGQLVQSSGAVQVSTYNVNTGRITTGSSIPGTWSAGDTLTIQQHVPHFTAADILTDVDGTVSGTAVDVVTDPAPTLMPAANYWLSTEGENVIPDLPLEAHPWLAALTAAEILMARGSSEMAQLSLQKADIRRTRLVNLFTPRNQGEPKKLVNRYGVMRRSRGSYSWGW